MTLQRTAFGEQIEAHLELARVVLFIGVALVLAVVLAVVFGWHGIAPSLQIVPDPAGAVGLPF
ncbi:MAG TPA: hypothetical protein VN771_07205 [Candidatus Baltobacteraceae bacterium]|nr:hypothetical protein [Candidatus Baltobacteraceae bacterium]